MWEALPTALALPARPAMYRSSYVAHSLDLNYCPVCGHALNDREAFGRMRRACPACDRIIFRDLKVAAGVLVEREGKVLLVRRSGGLRQGLWSFPAGFVECDEHPAETAVRECREETGLEVELTGILDVIGPEPEGVANIVIVYQARIVGGDLRAGDDADQVAFFAPEELPPLAFRATEIALGKWHDSQLRHL
jgi:ADP-ribose pyrophosphatase YjhB (NUDIX family)